jgi:hypothetical protein
MVRMSWTGQEDKSVLTERYMALVPEYISAVWPGPNPNSKYRLQHCVVTLFRCLVELVRLVKGISVTTHGFEGNESPGLTGLSFVCWHLDQIEIMSPDADEPIRVFSWKPVADSPSCVQLLLGDAVSFDFSKPERAQILRIYNHLLSVIESK